MTRRITYALALLSQGLSAVAQSTQAQFNQVINLNGDVGHTALQTITILIGVLDGIELSAVPRWQPSGDILANTATDVGQSESSTATRQPGHRHHWQPFYATEHQFVDHSN
jgi:hypothetical protein